MPQLNILSVIALWLFVSCGSTLYWILHHQQQTTTTSNISDTPNITTIRFSLVISLLFFNYLNILIALCEIALGRHIMLIKSDYQKLKQEYGSQRQHQQSNKNEITAAFNYLLMPLPWSRVLDGKLWCRMWSTYSLYDPSYQDDASFGFFIDVGNGWSTIPPGLLMNAAMALPRHCSPLLVGCVGLCSYWQIMYGTILYFLSFCWNQRYQGKKLVEVVGFVGVSNGIWLFFPIVGMYACVSILDTKDFSVFGYQQEQ
jgi:hypothetical protein